GCRGQVRGQRHVCRLELEALGVGEALERLDLPPIAAEHIRREAGSALRGVRPVGQLVRAQRGRQGRRGLLTACRKARRDGREERALLREDEGAGLPQRGPGGDERGTGAECLIDQRVQRRRFEYRPPPLSKRLGRGGTAGPHRLRSPPMSSAPRATDARSRAMPAALAVESPGPLRSRTTVPPQLRRPPCPKAAWPGGPTH